MEVPNRLVGDECYCGDCTGVPVCAAPTLPGLVPPEPVQQELPHIPARTPGVERYRASGKQVLHDNEHYGDMVNENAAACVADAMNRADEQADWAYIIAQAR